MVEEKSSEQLEFERRFGKQSLLGLKNDTVIVGWVMVFIGIVGITPIAVFTSNIFLYGLSTITWILGLIIVCFIGEEKDATR